MDVIPSERLMETKDVTPSKALSLMESEPRNKAIVVGAELFLLIFFSFNYPEMHVSIVSFSSSSECICTTGLRHRKKRITTRHANKEREAHPLPASLTKAPENCLSMPKRATPNFTPMDISTFSSSYPTVLKHNGNKPDKGYIDTIYPLRVLRCFVLDID